MIDCPHCDRPVTTDAYITGVATRWHSDDYHARRRTQLLRAARYVMTARIGHLNGHKVAIRFTATEAWYECQCGAVGHRKLWSGAAIADGRTHQHQYGDRYREQRHVVAFLTPNHLHGILYNLADTDDWFVDLPTLHPDRGGKLEIWAAEVWAKEQP